MPFCFPPAVMALQGPCSDLCSNHASTALLQSDGGMVSTYSPCLSLSLPLSLCLQLTLSSQFDNVPDSSSSVTLKGFAMHTEVQQNVFLVVLGFFSLQFSVALLWNLFFHPVTMQCSLRTQVCCISRTFHISQDSAITQMTRTVDHFSDPTDFIITYRIF